MHRFTSAQSRVVVSNKQRVGELTDIRNIIKQVNAQVERDGDYSTCSIRSSGDYVILHCLLGCWFQSIKPFTQAYPGREYKSIKFIYIQ